MRLPGGWVMLALGAAAVAGTAAGLLAAGTPLPWSPGGQALPPVRARVYNDAASACLLTGKAGLADPAAAREWTGMEDASRATSDRVSYLAAAAGPATEAGAASYLGSLLARGCQVIVAAGAPQRAAVLADAARYPGTRFIVTGPANGPANLTALPFTTTELPATVATAVETALHAVGG